MQNKMDEHVANVQDFQSMMSTHADWINVAEQTVASFKHPSKLVDCVLQQIDEHKVHTYTDTYKSYQLATYSPYRLF